MHYIIGTGFRIPAVQQQSVQPSVVTSINTGSSAPATAREWRDFEPGHTYALYNIQQTKEGVMYTFRSNSGAAEVEKVFESASQGDAYISAVRREQIPDYGTFYENRND